MKLSKLTLTAVLAFLLLGAQAQVKMTKEQYIIRYKALALENQELYGIPASITMAQAILESDCGNGRLAQEANNHFGIKCKKDWAGQTISHDDDEMGECFRKYDSVEESYRDHSEFLDKSPRYQALFELAPTDYKGWAYGLKSAGYATNPRYAELLIKMIEDNKLYTLDTGNDLDSEIERKASQTVPQVPTVEIDPSQKVDMDNYVVSLKSIGNYKVYSNNGSEFVVALQGDTFESLGRSLKISAKKLYKFNDLPQGSSLSAGDPVYIKTKSKKANNGKLIHVVKEGETMHSISQKYGIRLQNLSKINLREKDAQLREGQQIRLM